MLAGRVWWNNLTKQLLPSVQAADLARDYFKDAPNVFVEDSIPINDGWTRDWGPTVRPCQPALCPLSTAQAVYPTMITGDKP